MSPPGRGGQVYLSFGRMGFDIGQNAEKRCIKLVLKN
jgi:hypothetical protein